MCSPDVLQPIIRESWEELRDLFKFEWPKHELAYNTIQNYIDWDEKDSKIKDLEILSLNGNWRQTGAYLVLDRFQIFLYTLEEDCNSLKRALRLIDWDYSYRISVVLDAHWSTVDAVLKQQHIETRFYNKSLLFYLPREEALKFHIELPQGLQLKQLTAEHGVYANRLWPHRNSGSEYFIKRLAAWNVSMGLFSESGQLLGWCFQWQTGAIGPLEVLPEHYRKGYGTLLTKAIARELAGRGRNCYGNVSETNVASIGMFERLGFRLPCYHHWVSTKARKLCEWEV
ncbi:uncharacterized protein LOC119766421 [Culex quinquefasciatus]|uniref:uncharacterized protein LOC119766421 n=1 Tax=Culex quinquefasciatus TaxID=7176 RepID=UPI0018E2B4E8|nr:uncharacterized protein LOC119766421 [Culex quinquefasciatus]